MAASILIFPERRSLGLPPSEDGKPETAYAFVQRMCLEASAWLDKSPSAAAIFLEAAAHRLHREAINRSSPQTYREVSMSSKPNTPEPQTDPVWHLCAEWQEIEEQIKTLTAEALPPGRTPESDAREAALGEFQDRQNRIFDRIAETEPRTLNGFFAQLAVIRAELTSANATSDGDIAFHDPAAEATWRILGYANRFDADAEASPELLALIETERAMAERCDRAEDAPQHEYDAHWQRWWQAWELVEAFPVRSLVDLEIKTRAIARVHKENDKERAFARLVRDICQLAGVQPPPLPDEERAS